MKYNFNGKMLNIPDKEIEKMMSTLELTKEEAIQTWLEDNEYLDNAEQEELTQKVKESGIMSTIHGAKATTPKKQSKPKTVKVSDEKKEIFSFIHHQLSEFLTGEVEVLKENKLIQIKINGKTFKLDLIEQRPPKK